MRQTLISIACFNSALFFKIYNLRCGIGKPRLSRIGIISYSTTAATFESRNTYAPLQRRARVDFSFVDGYRSCCLIRRWTEIALNPPFD